MVEDLVILEDGSLGLCPDEINRSNRHTLLLKMFSFTLRYNSQETDSFPNNTEIEAEKLHDYYVGRACRNHR